MAPGLRQGTAGRELPLSQKRAGLSRVWGRRAGAIMFASVPLHAWLARIRQRRSLASLNDDLLRDLGLSRADADAESRKPFWRT